MHNLSPPSFAVFLINRVRLRRSYRVVHGSVWLNTRENHPAPRHPAVVPLAEQCLNWGAGAARTLP